MSPSLPVIQEYLRNQGDCGCANKNTRPASVSSIYVQSSLINYVFPQYTLPWNNFFTGVSTGTRPY